MSLRTFILFHVRITLTQLIRIVERNYICISLCSSSWNDSSIPRTIQFQTFSQSHFSESCHFQSHSFLKIPQNSPKYRHHSLPIAVIFLNSRMSISHIRHDRKWTVLVWSQTSCTSSPSHWHVSKVTSREYSNNDLVFSYPPIPRSSHIESTKSAKLK
jgi:hypothetical protein